MNKQLIITVDYDDVDDIEIKQVMTEGGPGDGTLEMTDLISDLIVELQGIQNFNWIDYIEGIKEDLKSQKEKLN